jgi:hypothetical protein
MVVGLCISVGIQHLEMGVLPCCLGPMESCYSLTVKYLYDWTYVVDLYIVLNKVKGEGPHFNGVPSLL